MTFTEITLDGHFNSATLKGMGRMFFIVLVVSLLLPSGLNSNSVDSSVVSHRDSVQSFYDESPAETVSESEDVVLFHLSAEAEPRCLSADCRVALIHQRHFTCVTPDPASCRPPPALMSCLS